MWLEKFFVISCFASRVTLWRKEENPLWKFLRGGNVLVNLLTFHAKSLIFQCPPKAADALLKRPGGSSLLLSSRRFKRLCRPVTIFMIVLVASAQLYFRPLQITLTWLTVNMSWKDFFKFIFHFLPFLWQISFLLCFLEAVLVWYF